MRAVLAKLQLPSLRPQELEEEIANLYAMRSYGREPFLAQGLLVNSQWYDQLRAKPNLYGRVLADRDVTSPDCFYMFIDADKTRLLEVSPFALQQLLGGQANGAAATKLIGSEDLFAQRLGTYSNQPTAPTDSNATTEPRRVIVPRGSVAKSWTPPPELATLHRKATGGDIAAMFELGYALDQYNTECRWPDDNQAAQWYRRAADAGNLSAMCYLGIMYEDGRGVGKDEAEAVRLYRKAADAGDVDGMVYLGVMYKFGWGVGKDEAEAVRWYRRRRRRGRLGRHGPPRQDV